MIRDEEFLERVVAGVHAITTSKAIVTWNAAINGRQFDVSVEFSIGTLRYLTVIEVKNKTRPASASDIEAFVLKARDNKANKAVFVTSAGYQSGAKVVAERHGLDLFTIEFDNESVSAPPKMSMIVRINPDIKKLNPPELSIGSPKLIVNLRRLTLFYRDGRQFNIPDEPSQMQYYVEHTKLSDGRTLSDIADSIPTRHLALDENLVQHIDISGRVDINPPDSYFFPRGRIRKIEWEFVGVLARPIEGNVRIDPGIFTHDVLYKDFLSGVVHRFNFGELPLGGSNIEVGKFYCILHPLIYYCCSEIEGDIVTWEVVETFQNVVLGRGIYTQDISEARRYIPVTDRSILRRLRGRRADFAALRARRQRSLER